MLLNIFISLKIKTDGMKLFFLFILSIFLFTSCSMLLSGNDKSLKTVSLHATVHKPYCGGAKPNPDIAAGYYESMKFEKFKILEGNSFKEGLPVNQEITLDESGNAIIQLKQGEYIFMRSDKFLPLDEFMAQNGPFEEVNYTIKGSECFQTWKNTVDMSLKVEGDTIVELRQMAKCWVGTNPCLEYTGPPAP